MPADRSWMYQRLDPDGDLRDEFTDGVKEFLNFAFRHPIFIREDKIKCPCRKCDNMEYHIRDDVAVHLYSKGFTHYYSIWYAHGEVLYQESAGVIPPVTGNETGISDHPQAKSRKLDGGKQKNLHNRPNKLQKCDEHKHFPANGSHPGGSVLCTVNREALDLVDDTHDLRSWGTRKSRRSFLSTPPRAEASPTLLEDVVSSGINEDGEQNDSGHSLLNITGTDDFNDGTRALMDPPKVRSLEIIGGSFVDPSVPRTIVRIIKNNFSQPWPTWKKVPREVRNLMFSKFEEKCSWNQVETSLVKDVWEKTCARRFRGILTQARDEAMKKANKLNVVDTKGFGPAWMKPCVWNSLITLYWSDEEWQKKSKTGQKNRLSERDGSISKHAGGSISFAAHKKKMSMELGRPVTQLELFDRTHKLKRGKGDFVDSKSKKVRDKYAAALTSKYGTNGSSELEFDPAAWLDAIGSSARGRRYGFGECEDAQKIYGPPCTSHASTSSFPGGSNFPKLLTKEEIAKLMQEKMQEMQEEINKEVQTSIRAMLSQFSIPLDNLPRHESSEELEPSEDSDSDSNTCQI